ncbi:MAG: 2-amino-4-hydroxy-6-hydroxymethyldihydropteridine diphosphokinase [bacterium]
MEIGLSLGSNLGDRLAHLKEAKRLIGNIPGLHITTQSFVYETSPVGVRGEFAHLPFLNAVLLLETFIQPGALLANFKKIEEGMGRIPSIDRNAPRPVDIDIIFAGDLLLNDANMTIPHPRWSSRRFVVQPLSDVRPDLMLPGQTQTVQALLSTLPPGQNVVLLEKEW